MHAMHLSSLIDSNLVFLQNEERDLAKIYEYMSQKIAERYPLTESQEVIMDRLLGRKLDEGILFPTGVAIPHLHLDNFDDTVISILVPNKPIKTEHGLIKIFFMMINGTKDNSLYLKILQSTIKLSKDTTFFDQLLAQKNISEFTDFLSKGDFSVKESITVSDLMERKIFTIKAKDTVKDLSNLFYQNDINYVPVLNDQGNFVGEITLRNYLMLGFPEYTKFLPNLNFLKAFEPFEKLIKMEDQLVENIMQPVKVFLTPDTSIFEAIFLMNKHDRRDFPIVKDGKILGIISLKNIFRKVIKG